MCVFLLLLTIYSLMVMRSSRSGEYEQPAAISSAAQKYAINLCMVVQGQLVHCTKNNGMAGLLYWYNGTHSGGKKQKQWAFLYQGTVGGVWSEFAGAAHDLFFKLSSDSMEKYCLCSFNFSKFNDTLPNDWYKIKAILNIWSTMLSWLYVVRFTTLHDARTQRGSSFIYDCLPLLA